MNGKVERNSGHADLVVIMTSAATEEMPDSQRCPLCGVDVAAAAVQCIQCGEPIAGAPGPRPRRFRWRLIPTFLAGFFGGLYFCFAVLGLVFWAKLEHVPPDTLRYAAVLAAASCPWIAASRLWWKRRWAWAVVMTAAGLIAGFIAVRLSRG